MVRRLLTQVLTIAALVVHSYAQCPNALAVYNYNSRTMSANNTWFLVPVPKETVLKALNEAYPGNSLFKKLSLLDLSADERIPKDLYAGGMHPILTVGGLSADIRINALQISGPLLSASVGVPFVSYNGGKTPMLAPLNGYIGGENRGTLIDKLRLAGLIPALVSSLVGGFFLRVGDFLPTNAAYQCGSNGECFENSKWTILPNEISGPGIYPEAVDTTFRATSAPRYSLDFWQDAINQPSILKGIMTGQCQLSTYYFNESTAEVQYRSGEVTFGPSASGLGLTRTTLQGKYNDLHGISACSQTVGFAAKLCDEFA